MRSILTQSMRSNVRLTPRKFPYFDAGTTVSRRRIAFSQHSKQLFSANNFRMTQTRRRSIHSGSSYQGLKANRSNYRTDIMGIYTFVTGFWLPLVYRKLKALSATRCHGHILRPLIEFISVYPISVRSLEPHLRTGPFETMNPIQIGWTRQTMWFTIRLVSRTAETQSEILGDLDRVPFSLEYEVWSRTTNQNDD